MNTPWKEVTIYDIAEKLGVSAATVSRALNDRLNISEVTKDKVLKMAEEMNFVHDSGRSTARRGLERVIALIVPHYDRDNMAEILCGILDMAERLRYNIVPYQSLGKMAKEAQTISEVIKHKVDGVLISIGSEMQSMEHLKRLRLHKIPVCTFNNIWKDDSAGQLQIDNTAAAEELTNHLIQQGCRRIAFVTSGHPTDADQTRLYGYQSALKKNKIPHQERLVFQNETNPDKGEKTSTWICKLAEKPDGIIFSDIRCAISCMNKLIAKGFRVPEDIAFTAFNEHNLGHLSRPELTSIDLKAYQTGQLALVQLVNQINDNTQKKAAPMKITLKHNMEIKKSSMKTIPDKII